MNTQSLYRASGQIERHSRGQGSPVGDLQVGSGRRRLNMQESIKKKHDKRDNNFVSPNDFKDVILIVVPREKKSFQLMLRWTLHVFMKGSLGRTG